MERIWFILGLSGAGKTYLARSVCQVNDWVHFDLDQPLGTAQDVLASYGFRGGADEWKKKGSPALLLRQVRERFTADGKKGAVLSFPSSFVLTARQLAVLRKSAKVFYLAGPRETCLQEFLRREHETGRNLPQEYWNKNNSKLLAALADPAMSKWAIDAFAGSGERRTAEELVALAGAV